MFFGVTSLPLLVYRTSYLVARGTAAQLMAREGDYAQVRLPSGETRRVHVECYASIVQIGNHVAFMVLMFAASLHFQALLQAWSPAATESGYRTRTPRLAKRARLTFDQLNGLLSCTDRSKPHMTKMEAE